MDDGRNKSKSVIENPRTNTNSGNFDHCPSCFIKRTLSNHITKAQINFPPIEPPILSRSCMALFLQGTITAGIFYPSHNLT